MCAVISHSIWAGWLYKVTAHTPAFTFTKNDLNFKTSLETKSQWAPVIRLEAAVLPLFINEFNRNAVGYNPLFKSFLEQATNGLAPSVGVVQG